MIYMAKTGQILFFKNQYKLFEKRSVQRCYYFVRRVISQRSLEPFRYLLPGRLYLESVSVVITTKCTLRCKYCGSLMNLYKDPQDADDMMIRKTIEKLSEYTDKINTLVLIGGEPFCNPNLKHYIRAVPSGTCEHIVIVTNGTLSPADPELIAAMKENRVVVSFSNYGELSRRQDEFIARLKKEGIRCVVHSQNMQWYDNGDFEVRKKSQKELDRQFARCSGTQCVNIINGFVYTCTRSSHGNDLGLIETPEDEFVDILHLDKKEFVNQMKKKLLHRNRALTACRYCSYNEDCRTVPRAAQEEKRGA